MKIQILTESFEKLGLMGWPLLACSTVGLAITLERLLYFMRQPCRQKMIREAIEFGYSEETAYATAQGLSTYKSPISPMAVAFLSNVLSTRSIRKEASEGPIRIWLSSAKAPVKILATIAQIAPLLGLTGTVLGLVETFKVMQSSQQAIDPSLMAGGIWEALLTTIAGMLISIPLLLCIRFFNAQLERVAREAKELYIWLEAQKLTPESLLAPEERGLINE